MIISLFCLNVRANELQFDCKEVTENIAIYAPIIIRCENYEVVCYTYRKSNGYLNCKFKN